MHGCDTVAVGALDGVKGRAAGKGRPPIGPLVGLDRTRLRRSGSMQTSCRLLLSCNAKQSASVTYLLGRALGEVCRVGHGKEAGRECGKM